MSYELHKMLDVAHYICLRNSENIDQCIEQSARDSIQKLMGALFSLPTTSSPDGPLAILPPPVLLLPREKPLPKPKEPTKWEKFAAAKGIKKTRREKKIWDEEKQEWVQRWGWKGKNKEVETQWLHEVPSNAGQSSNSFDQPTHKSNCYLNSTDVDNDPRKNAKDERKARIAKNERQRLQNLSHTSGSLAHTSTDRKKEIDHVLATTRTSTASMGKFDRQLDGEKKPRGLKRKVLTLY